jgi:4-hydroxy-tetrahydrodipicolinate synthase
MNAEFKGVWVAMVTPNNDDDKVLTQLLTKFNKAGVQGVFILGTTGEGILLTPSERKLFAEKIVTLANGMGVIVHVSHDHFAEVLDLAQHASKISAQAVAVGLPAHYRLDPQEIADYFICLAEKVEIPILIYDIPSVTGNTLSQEALEQILKRTNNVIGLKVSHYDWKLWEYVLKLAVIEDINVLVGVDNFCLAALSNGATGIVSGPANVFPEIYVELYQAIQNRDICRAIQCQQLINEICQIVHYGMPLAFIKEALDILGYPVGPVRPPLRQLTSDEKEALAQALASFSKEVATLWGGKEVISR